MVDNVIPEDSSLRDVAREVGQYNYEPQGTRESVNVEDRRGRQRWINSPLDLTRRLRQPQRPEDTPVIAIGPDAPEPWQMEDYTINNFYPPIGEPGTYSRTPNPSATTPVYVDRQTERLPSWEPDVIVHNEGAGRFANPMVGEPEQSPYQEFLATSASLNQETPRALSGNPTGETLGQHNLLPRVGEVALAPYDAFVRAWEDMSRGEQTNPGDILTTATALIPGVPVARAQGGNTLGVFGGELGASRTGRQAELRPNEALASRQRNYEINDSEARLTPQAETTLFSHAPEPPPAMSSSLDRGNGWTSVDTSVNAYEQFPYQAGVFVDRPLITVLDHPELYANYPELANTTITMRSMPNVPGGARGYYDRYTNHIELAVSHPETAREAILHEVQHAVQGLERMPRGASARETPVSVPVINNIMGDYSMREVVEAGVGPQFQAAIIRAAERVMPEFAQYAGEIRGRWGRDVTLVDLNNFSQSLPASHRMGGMQERIAERANQEIYLAAEGENQAWATGSRAGMTAEQRAALPMEPIVPPRHQITRYTGDNPMEMSHVPNTGTAQGILQRLGVPEENVRIRTSAPDPATGDISKYLIVTDPSGGPNLRIRISNHPGHVRAGEIDAHTLGTPEALERAISDRLSGRPPERLPTAGAVPEGAERGSGYIVPNESYRQSITYRQLNPWRQQIDHMRRQGRTNREIAMELNGGRISGITAGQIKSYIKYVFRGD